MDKLSVTKGIFTQLLSGEIPKNEILLLATAVDDGDIEWLMGEVESLTDPSAYFKGTAQGDENAVTGFFLYVDLISALIIHAGPSAQEHAARIGNPASTYAPWVIKYVSEPRFHGELLEKFGLKAQ